MHTDITKRDLGRFVTERRRALGLTQKELAARLHVTESAVSKWERGLSYPDITMVQALAAELGVTGQELISASEDHEARADTRDAKMYRGWRSALLWSTGIAYAATILTCLIVNLSVSHTLSWFWIVLAAVGIAFSLTTLPMLGLPHPGWWALGGATASLVALLLLVWAQAAPGMWLWIAVAAVLLGLLVVFTPILLALLPLPEPLRRHRTVLTLAIDTVALALFLGVIALAIGQPGLWLTRMLPLAAVGVALVWALALVIRYVPGPAALRISMVAALLGAGGVVVDWAVARILGQPWQWAPNLLVWNDDTIDVNIKLLVVIGAFAVVVVGAVGGIVLHLANRPAAALATPENPEVD
ncbi:helix-turn-helix domain-containing protein [Leucobacter chromiireducens]|uniref:helix-turn-helix domain-containing protein n=1 Tax=Leucobacter chromiireducens TaxID=283877 RepID=UPI000F636E70|nr:helix-turn-helix transcriptional regulator [Leucobacter chromiireducens]